jgi:hypothetical protein
MSKYIVPEGMLKAVEAPEPEVLEEIKDLLDSTDDPIFNGWKKKILEAYLRGKESSKQ